MATEFDNAAEILYTQYSNEYIFQTSGKERFFSEVFRRRFNSKSKVDALAMEILDCIPPMGHTSFRAMTLNFSYRIMAIFSLLATPKIPGRRADKNETTLDNKQVLLFGRLHTVKKVVNACRVADQIPELNGKTLVDVLNYVDSRWSDPRFLNIKTSYFPGIGVNGILFSIRQLDKLDRTFLTTGALNITHQIKIKGMERDPPLVVCSSDESKLQSVLELVTEESILKPCIASTWCFIQKSVNDGFSETEINDMKDVLTIFSTILVRVQKTLESGRFIAFSAAKYINEKSEDVDWSSSPLASKGLDSIDCYLITRVLGHAIAKFKDVLSSSSGVKTDLISDVEIYILLFIAYAVILLSTKDKMRNYASVSGEFRKFKVDLDQFCDKMKVQNFVTPDGPFSNVLVAKDISFFFLNRVFQNITTSDLQHHFSYKVSGILRFIVDNIVRKRNARPQMLKVVEVLALASEFPKSFSEYYFTGNTEKFEAYYDHFKERLLGIKEKLSCIDPMDIADVLVIVPHKFLELNFWATTDSSGIISELDGQWGLFIAFLGINSVFKNEFGALDFYCKDRTQLFELYTKINYRFSQIQPTLSTGFGSLRVDEKIGRLVSKVVKKWWTDLVATPT
jgi:hypothetical protein